MRKFEKIDLKSENYMSKKSRMRKIENTYLKFENYIE